MLDSVRVRLTLWYSLVLAVVLVLLAVFTYFLYWRSISQRTDTGLVELADAFVTTFNAELKDETGAEAVRNAAHVAMVEHRFRDTAIAVLSPAHQIVETSLELPTIGPSREQIPVDLFSSNELHSLVPETASHPSALGYVSGGLAGFRAFSRPLPAAGQNFTLVVLQSLQPQQEMMGDIRNTFLWAIPVALLLASIGGYFLARASLAPVAAMASQARRMGAEHLHDRLAVANQRDELGQLAISFNQLLERLEKSFELQRRFVADASHELRTPVAILRGETEVALSKPDRAPGEYREALAILRDESRRLAHIIEDLFTLTRADAGQYPLALRELYLDDLASDVLHHARSLAITKSITLSSSIDPDLPLEADESLFRRLLLNLLDNAIKYTPPGGTVSLSCSKHVGQYVVSVTDTGPGIPSEIQPRIFERFFRADKTRSRSERDSGGAGLGLSIARWIAEAHHGRLELTRSDSAGSTFTLYLPIAVSPR